MYNGGGFPKVLKKDNLHMMDEKSFNNFLNGKRKWIIVYMMRPISSFPYILCMW
jgi:hypothetical protein